MCRYILAKCTQEIFPYSNSHAGGLADSASV